MLDFPSHEGSPMLDRGKPSRCLAKAVGLGVLAVVGWSCSEPPPVAVGTLERPRIELRAERQEPILRLPVAEGETVRAGELVAELDGRRIAARLAGARASTDLARARLAELVRGSRQEDIEQARAELEAAEAELAERRPNLVRIENLVRQGIETASNLDTARASLDAATARRKAAGSALERQLNGTTREELDQARAEILRAEAEITGLEIDAERLNVRAPRAGILDALPFEVGDEPPAGAVLAVLLTDVTPYARVYIPAELRPGVAVGQAVSVHVDGFEKAFEGRVRVVSQEAAFTPYFSLTERDRGHLSYVAEIDLLQEDARHLANGLPVEVSF